MVDGWEVVVNIGSGLDLYSLFVFSRTTSGAQSPIKIAPLGNDGIVAEFFVALEQGEGWGTAVEMMRRGQPIMYSLLTVGTNCRCTSQF